MKERILLEELKKTLRAILREAGDILFFSPRRNCPHCRGGHCMGMCSRDKQANAPSSAGAEKKS
ncbi:MAG: hypothetical protein LBR31_03225 [Desulfovibrio sp.]|nr:hypothetical protein [Desulfovibrio sp.]